MLKSFREVVRGYLRVALVDGNSASGKLAPEVWTSVEGRLSAKRTKGIHPQF